MIHSNIRLKQYGTHESENDMMIDEFDDVNVDESGTNKVSLQLIVAMIAISVLSLCALTLNSVTGNTLLRNYSIYGGKKTTSPSAYPSSAPTGIPSSSLYMIISNEYGESTTEKYPYSFLADALFAETYKNNTVSINSATDACSYAYTISKVNDSFTVSGFGVDGKFYFEPKSTGLYSFVLLESCNGIVTRNYTSDLWSKYVRRDVSELTESDREEFLDAFATLWNVNTLDGQKIYGDKYKSLWYFAVIHQDAGASLVCDEFHKGSGFINNHVLLGSYLEQSLQLVNPRTCLHYMEYVKLFDTTDSSAYKSHKSNELDGGSWTELLTSTYFGSSDPYTGRILDGRWADITLPYLTEDFYIESGVDPEGSFFPVEASEQLFLGQKFFPELGYHMTSPYGLLRAPWNFSPSNYTIRYNAVNGISTFNGIPGSITKYYDGVACSDYQKLIDDSTDEPLSTFLTLVEDDSHGPIHFSFGGAGGNIASTADEYLRETYGFSDSDLLVVAQTAQKFFKSKLTVLLESGNISSIEAYHGCCDLKYPVVCSAFPWDGDTLNSTAAPGTYGGPACKVNPTLWDPVQIGIDSVIHAGNPPWITTFPIMQYNNATDDFLDLIFADYEEGMDQYDTYLLIMSYNDTQKNDIIGQYASRFQFDGDMAGSGAATDPLFWVAHGAVERLFQRFMFLGLSNDTAYADVYETCSGHMTNGTKAWLEGFYFEDKSVQAANLTNAELTDILNPTSDLHHLNIPFIYDHSDWPSFCEFEDFFTATF